MRQLSVASAAVWVIDILEADQDVCGLLSCRGAINDRRVNVVPEEISVRVEDASCKSGGWIDGSHDDKRVVDYRPAKLFIGIYRGECRVQCKSRNSIFEKKNGRTPLRALMYLSAAKDWDEKQD